MGDAEGYRGHSCCWEGHSEGSGWVPTGIASDTSKLEQVSIRWRFLAVRVFLERRRLFSPVAQWMMHPEDRRSIAGDSFLCAALR